ncbi:MAG: hypothetical protein H0V16_03040 [Burkholderiaceae bacterium]|nr:hypothetical protein [Burkholderiaceae bacterium]
MNKKFLIAWVVLFIAWMAGDFLVHGVLLKPDYLQLARLYRSDAESQAYFQWMLLAHVLMAGAFAWIYARGRETKPWKAQGVRYGLAVALLGVIPGYLIYYAVQPLPGVMVVKQIIFSGILIVVLGIIVAWLYRDTATP